MQRRYARDQVRNCYTALNELFDVLSPGAVIWEPYTQDVMEAKYPGGMSVLCTRDRGYWMMTSKIVFDVCVEEMSQQRIMRQFGLRQLEIPPQTPQPIPPVVHKYVYLRNIFIFFTCKHY